MNGLRHFMETNATLMLALMGTAVCFEGAHDPQAGFAAGGGRYGSAGRAEFGRMRWMIWV